MYYLRSFKHRDRTKVREYIADYCGVTVEHLLAVIEKRKAWKKAKYYRLWKRRKAVKVGGTNGRHIRPKSDEPYAQEGELHLMLHAIGLSAQEFCALMGMSYATFRGWYGTCLYAWPLELMRYYGWSQNMAARLRELGQDPEALKPQLPTPKRPGMYPRKKGDLVLVKPAEYSPYKKV